MAPSYSNGYGYAPTPYTSHSSAYDYSSKNHADFQSICDDILAGAKALLRRMWRYSQGPGRHQAGNLAVRGGQQVRRNLVRRRILSFPHLLVILWVLALLWGERWTFASKVRSCDWDRWEDWSPGTTPHRLIFIADPQIIDPHSYPGRPWPLNPLTMRITDNYMRRSYIPLQKYLHPDTVFFLGDLFDGGREWKTARGDFNDPEWAKNHRPEQERKLLDEWHRKYGEEYWLEEYDRFGSIFYDNWNLGGAFPGPGQRGRKLVSSLPGNHDLGFGAEVKVPARHRFNAYFGETNRVDVIGNHTFVSVDTLSLSAGTSRMRATQDLERIFAPPQEFLKGVKATKRKAVQKELRFWSGATEDLAYPQKVEDVTSADYSHLPTLDRGEENAPDFPTILLTHVPLHRDSGTPCGPMREHWPPAKPPAGQTEAVIPDHRNAISVSGGYQYQNVLSPEDSILLVESIGNVVHAFSGDDHDYCEVVHSKEQQNVREITVKSFSMAMGVMTPGFQMVSLYNPVDEQGHPIGGSSAKTLQTHLCLLPSQLSTYLMYAILGVATILILTARAFLVPALNLELFALGPIQHAPSAVLPVFKAKVDTDEDGMYDRNPSPAATSASSLSSAARFSSTRTRGQSITSGAEPAGKLPQPAKAGGGRFSGSEASHNKTNTSDKWGWGSQQHSSRGGPRIEIRRDNYYVDRMASRGGGGGGGSNSWRPSSASSRPRHTFGVVWGEIWTTSWRVIWIALLFYAWLTYKG